MRAPAQASRVDRGWTYLQLDDFRNAEREFATALKQQPSFHPAETGLAYVALARGNEKDAATRFERALEAEPAYVPALVGRGQALLELDRAGDALASFEAALAKDASLTDLRSRVDVLRFRATQDMLARAKTAAEARRWEEAKAAYQQAIAASPESAFLYRDLAGVERQAGQLADALEHYRRAVQLDRDGCQVARGDRRRSSKSRATIWARWPPTNARRRSSPPMFPPAPSRGCGPVSPWQNCPRSIAPFPANRR